MQSVSSDHLHEGSSVDPPGSSAVPSAAAAAARYHDPSSYAFSPFNHPVDDEAHEFYRHGFPASPARPDIVVAGHEYIMPTASRVPMPTGGPVSRSIPSVRSVSTPSNGPVASSDALNPSSMVRTPSGGVRDRINQFNEASTQIPVPLKSGRAPTSDVRPFPDAPSTITRREPSGRKEATPRRASDGRNATLRRKTNSHDPHTPPPVARQDSGSRPPLFGEVLVNGHESPGYGIPALMKQRSNIEARLPMPTAPFVDEHALSDTEEPRFSHSPRSPHSPRHAANRLQRPPPRDSLHRRTQSETSGVLKANSEKSTYDAEPNRGASSTESYGSSSPGPHTTSRIPVKSRRSSTPATSPPSHSHLSSSRGPAATARSQSRHRLHKDVQARSRPVTPPSYRRYDPSTMRSRAPQETMNAIFQAPPPAKVSPRLRSSRPRQPVSSASTAASRARAAERAGSPSPAHPTHARSPGKIKRVQGAPDFHTRRGPWQKNASTRAVPTIPRSPPSPRTLTKPMPTAEREQRYAESTPGAWPNSPDTPKFRCDGSRPASPVKPAVASTDIVQPPRLGLAVTGLPLATDQEQPASAVTDIEVDGSSAVGSDADYQTAGPVTAPQEPTTLDPSPIDDPALDPCSSTDDCASISDQADNSHLANGIVLNDCSATDSCAETSDDLDSDREEQSIQVALRNTPLVASDGPWTLDPSRALPDHTHRGLSPLTPQAEDYQDDASDVACSILPEDSVSVVMASRQVPQPGPTPPPKVPLIHERPPENTVHTLTSEARSVVNRVFDHYHALQNLSPEMADQFKREVEAATPHMPRHAAWESKEDTQLYLQDILDGPLTPTASRHNRDVVPSETGTGLSHYPFVGKLPTEDHPGTAIVYGEPSAFDPSSVNTVRTIHHGNSASVSTLRPSPGPDGNPSPVSHSFPDPGPELLPSTAYQPQRSDGTQDAPAMSGAVPHDDTGTLQTSATIHLGLAPDALPAVERTRSTPPIPTYAPPLPPSPAAMDTLDLRNVHPPPLSPSGFYNRNALSAISQPGHAQSSAFQYISHSMDRPQTTAGASAVDAAQAVAEPPAGLAPPLVAPQDSAVDLETLVPAKSKLLKDLIERKNILKELCDTEFSYQQDMIILESMYKSTSLGILSDADRKVLFGNSEQICQFATKLQDALKQAVAAVYVMPRQNRWNAKRGSFSTSSSATNDTTAESDTSLSESDRNELDRCTRVGFAFLSNMEEIERVYNVYLRNHTAANNKLTELKAEPNVETWMEECRKMAADLTSAWNLDALLVKPTQRITKYPLILRNLLQVTPKDHPDYADIERSLLQLEELLHKLNDSKKRAELVDQAMNQTRRRKESDIRLFPQKFVNRRAEKLKQQVGLSNSAIDADYDVLSQRFGGHFFQLQIVIRDVENYIREVQAYVTRYGHFLSACEHLLGFDIQSQHPVEQSHFVIFARTVREIIAVALPEHTARVRKSVIEPILSLWQLHENPQQMMRKRKKRVVDYAKWKAMADRGETPDKKLREAADQFTAINETLKDELPKLYNLSSRLVQACLENFIELQRQWQDTWMRKLEPAAREPQITDDYQSDMFGLVRDYHDNFAYVDERMQTLGLLNGKTLEDASQFASVSPSLYEDSSSKRPSTIGSRRATSVGGESSPSFPPGRDSHRISDNFSPPFSPPGSGYVLPDTFTLGSPPATRARAGSAISSRGPSTPRSVSAQNLGNAFYPPSAATRLPEVSAVPPRLSIDLPSDQPPSPGFAAFRGSMYGAPVETAEARSRESVESTVGWHSGIFNSAMPMSDSPRDATHPSERGAGGEESDPDVIFVAASLFEFRIDDARSFVGFPYLQYSMGEIFDVIGQQGELWLARNQDDPDGKLGWIWEKHFARILPDG